MNIQDVKFDEKGLVPAIVQDFYTKEVLTLAYMNKESLEITLNEKRTCFYSRSRKELWHKGETSGNVQHVVSINADCDSDALIVQVIKTGPACHTGAESCFYKEMFKDEDKKNFTLNELYKMLETRNNERPQGSYTTYLFEKGLEKILKKVGEENTEVIIAAMKDDKEETVYEIADLCYHVFVMMISMGITPSEVLKELASRHVIDHKVKQETMK